MDTGNSTAPEQRTCCPTSIDQEHLTDLCTRPALARHLDPSKVCLVLEEVFEARRKLHVEHGEQNHDDGTSYAHLRERSAIAARECDRADRDGTQNWRLILRKVYRAAIAQDDPTALRSALLELAATAVEWVEAIDRRAAAR